MKRGTCLRGDRCDGIMDNELQKPGRRPFTSPGLVDNLTTRYERNKEKVAHQQFDLSSHPGFLDERPINGDDLFRQNSFGFVLLRKSFGKVEDFGIADVFRGNVVGCINGNGFFAVGDDGSTAGHEIAELENVTCNSKKSKMTLTHLKRDFITY